MNNFPLLIVGQGIAGTVLAVSLQQRGIPFVIVNQSRNETASKVASGLYNPIVLKRMKPVWNAAAMIEALYPFYDYCEAISGCKFHYTNKVIRVFKSVKEQNDWHAIASSESFGLHLNPDVQFNAIEGIETPYGFGEVINSGRIDTELFLSAMRSQWLETGNYVEAPFHYTDLEVNDYEVHWQGTKYQRVVFCEGYRCQLHNPFFKELPFAATKGEVMQVIPQDSEWELRYIVNGGVFIMPLPNQEFKVGATYAWDTFDEAPTKEALQELGQKFQEITDLPVSITGHRAGIRPTVRDRKPLLGWHPVHRKVGIFNGLGSRGILMAPWLATVFVDAMQNDTALPKELDINRFTF